MTTAINRSRTTNTRRTRSDIVEIENAMVMLLEQDHPMTVRQLYYRLVSDGVIAKTECEYKQTVIRLLCKLRRSGAIPFGWIADNTRWMRRPDTYSGLRECLAVTAQTYRRSVWDDQDTYVEIWLEKDALAGVLVEETYKWDVPLMVTRGYASLSYLYESAQTIIAVEKPAHLYYFGDHDPSGLDITRAVEKGLREFAPDAEIHFHRIAVTPQQIGELNLPTRPTKTLDTRSRHFEGESVEVDAIPARELRRLAREAIESHINKRALRETRRIEKLELDTLAEITAHWGNGA